MGRIRSATRASVSMHPSDHRLANVFGGKKTSAGVAVDERTALSVPSAWACVTQYADDIASLPKHLHERLDRGRQQATGHPVYDLIKTKPNPELDAFTFYYVMEAHAAGWGAATAEIEWNRSGRPVALWPIPPYRVRAWRPERGQPPVVDVRLPDGQTRRLTQDRVLRVLWATFDGVSGVSPVQVHREALGLSYAAQQYGARFFSQDATAKVYLSHPETLSETGRHNLRQSWEEMTVGLDNAHRAAVLEEGVQVHQVSINPDDAQWLESRKFQSREIASMWNMPPHKIQDLENAHLANIEQESINYVVGTLRPRLVRWEQAIDSSLLGPRERRRFFSRIDPEGLLRGDIKSRYEAYATARQWGWLSANDVRELEDMQPIDGGDAYMRPLNMVDVGSSAQPQGSGSQGRAEALVRPLELQAGQRSVEERRQIREQYRDPIRQAVQAVVEREARAVREAVDASMSAQQVSDALDPVYADGSDVRTFAADRVGGQLKALIDEIVPVAEDEAGGRGRGQRQEVEQETFAAEVVDRWTAGYVGESERRLRGAALDNPDDPAGAVDGELDRWEEDRAEIEARRRTVEVAEASAVFGFAAAGVQRMKWRSVGENCPYCSDLDGREVGTQERFVSAGSSVSPSGQQPLTPSSDVGHPPLHDACDCLVAPA